VNKTELIEEIVQRTDSSKAEAHKYMESFEEVVAEALRGGEEIQITGFGKFYVPNRRFGKASTPRPKKRYISPPLKYLRSARVKASRRPSRELASAKRPARPFREHAYTKGWVVP